MPKKWTEVIASPQFQSLSPSDQEAARQQYFTSVIVPQVPVEALEQVKRQFDMETANGAFRGDVTSGDEARSRAVGDTRATMRPQDIEAAYDVAQQRGDRPEQQAMSRAYVQRERADSPTTMAIGDRVRAFARGVPVLGGIADEVNAGLNSVMPGQNYEKALDYQRARDTVFDEANPGQSMALQLGGGLASGIGIAGAVGPALAATPRAIALGTGLTGGAILGGIDGFTRGEGLDDRVGKAVIGGTVGGLFGLGAPIAGKAIDKVTNRVVDALLRRDSLNGLGLSRPSAEVLMRTMQNDGTLGARGVANIRSAGPDAMLVDAGPNSAAVLDTAIQRGGPGVVAARDAIEGRVTNASANVGQAMDASLGQPVGVATADRAIRQGSAPARGNAYDAAYAQPIDYARPEAREIENFLSRLPASVVEKANTLMRLEGEQSQQIMARIGQDGSVTYQTMPDVRQLDYITRAMRDISRNGDGKGILGGNTQEGRAYGNLARRIRDNLRTLVPGYGQALDTAAEPIAQRQALELGSQLLSPGLARDEAAQQIAGMGRAELDQVRQGVRSKIDETLANVKRTMTDPNVDARQAVRAIKDLSSDAAREKIRMVVGDDAANQLFGRIDEAARAFDLRAAVAQNSKTFARQATKEGVDQATEPGAVGLLLEGSPVKATRSVVQALLGTGPQARLAKQDRIYSEVVQALTGPRGADAENFARSLQDVYRRQGQGQQLGRGLSILATGAGAGMGYRGFADYLSARDGKPREMMDGFRPRF